MGLDVVYWLSGVGSAQAAKLDWKDGVNVALGLGVADECCRFGKVHLAFVPSIVSSNSKAEGNFILESCCATKLKTCSVVKVAPCLQGGTTYGGTQLAVGTTRRHMLTR